MKFLESFSQRTPIPQHVQTWTDYIDKKYTKFTDTEFGKLVLVDDKNIFLKDKGELTDRIFYDIQNRVRGIIHIPSLRKAIKNWIDEKNK